MKLKNIFLFFTFYFLFFVIVSTAQAAGLIPCEGLNCKFCHLLQLVAKVINFALYDIAIPLVVVFIVWGGLKIMIAGGSTEKVTEGRKIIQSAIIGVFIALGAWMIINTILSVISDNKFKFKPWEFWGKPQLPQCDN